MYIIMKVNEFKKGLFSLRTRKFGTVSETMMKQLLNLESSTNLAYDMSQGKKRIEIKSSMAISKVPTIKEDNIISQIKSVPDMYHLVSTKDASKSNFDCNIQQIKCKDLDELYYSVYFNDSVLIFKMSAKDIKNYEGYCDKQHRYNEGEGQFHINSKNIDYHIKNHLFKKITYKELYNLVK